MTTRSNYATLSVQELLAPTPESLDVPWATFAGNRSSAHGFTVETSDAREPYLQLQAFDVSEYGHDILLNGDSLTGFDIPPAEGWQTWMDTITGPTLHAGENTLRIERDTTTDDAFAVGTVVVHWLIPEYKDAAQSGDKPDQ